MRTADEILAELYTDAGRRSPYPLYDELHRLGPASLTPASEAYAAVANGYDVVDQVLRDPRFVKGGGAPKPDDDPIVRALYNSMMFRTEPDHGRMRRVFNQVFTPRRVAALEPRIEELTDELLDRLAELGAGGVPVDFIAEFGYLLPAGVMSALLGIPEPDLAWFRVRVQRVEDFLDLGGRTPEKIAAANEAATEMSDYYRSLIARRRAEPADDLISGLVQALEDQALEGQPALTDDELIGNLLVLFNASFVTTINLLGNALPPLLDGPAGRRRDADPGRGEPGPRAVRGSGAVRRGPGGQAAHLVRRRAVLLRRRGAGPDRGPAGAAAAVPALPEAGAGGATGAERGPGAAGL